MVMTTKPQNISELFASGGDVRYVLPHFQREYAWDKAQWQTLYDDVKYIYKARSEHQPPHFMGALVVIQEVETAGTMSQFTLVDGQQRLTTISLLLCVIKEHLELDSERRVEIERLLTNPGRDGETYYKIVPTQKYNDQKAYFAIIDGEKKIRSESNIVKAWEYYRKLLSGEDSIDIEEFYNCIVNHMQVVFIKLDRDDKPFKIFESLNAKGKRLSQADLVRNYIAMKLPPDRQLKVFNQYWAPIDCRLKERNKVARIGELTAFLRHYLAMTYGTLTNKEQVYVRFRDHMEDNYSDSEGFIGELKRLHQFAEFYDNLLRPKQESNPRIQDGIERLNIIAESVTYPLLLRFYDWYSSEDISAEEFSKALRVVENFAVRVFLAGVKSSSLTKLFPSLPSELDRNDFLPSLTNVLLSRNYPSDTRIRQTFPISFQYTAQTRKKLILVLLTIDKHLARESDGHPVLNGPETIEHIMPQKLSPDWRKEIGNTDHAEYLDNVGNLTLVTQEWNSKLSNGTFAEKKSKLMFHALRINIDYFNRQIDQWNAQAIQSRADWLTQHALKVWHALSSFIPPDSVRESSPSLLSISGERHKVKQWQDVLVRTVEELMPRFANFDDAAQRFESNISRRDSGFAMSHQLENGFYLKTNLSENAIYSFCKRFAEAAGLDDREWHVEYE
ncbi:MAG: DUF262 domain-containing protein [Chloroflexi bacterium]|nr:DUF262 domain-containing protein [Chloroflexota bacterium]